jgi:hypothetical protein
MKTQMRKEEKDNRSDDKAAILFWCNVPCISWLCREFLVAGSAAGASQE